MQNLFTFTQSSHSARPQRLVGRGAETPQAQPTVASKPAQAAQQETQNLRESMDNARYAELIGQKAEVSIRTDKQGRPITLKVRDGIDPCKSGSHIAESWSAGTEFTIQAVATFPHETGTKHIWAKVDGNRWVALGTLNGTEKNVSIAGTSWGGGDKASVKRLATFRAEECKVDGSGQQAPVNPADQPQIVAQPGVAPGTTPGQPGVAPGTQPGQPGVALGTLPFPADVEQGQEGGALLSEYTVEDPATHAVLVRLNPTNHFMEWTDEFYKLPAAEQAAKQLEVKQELWNKLPPETQKQLTAMLQQAGAPENLDTLRTQLRIDPQQSEGGTELLEKLDGDLMFRKNAQQLAIFNTWLGMHFEERSSDPAAQAEYDSQLKAVEFLRTAISDPAYAGQDLPTIAATEITTNAAPADVLGALPHTGQLLTGEFAKAVPAVSGLVTVNNFKDIEKAADGAWLGMARANRAEANGTWLGDSADKYEQSEGLYRQVLQKSLVNGQLTPEKELEIGNEADKAISSEDLTKTLSARGMLKEEFWKPRGFASQTEFVKKMVADARTDFAKRLTFEELTKDKNNFDLKGDANLSAALEEYKSLQGVGWQVSDATVKFMTKELAINAALFAVSGGVANVALRGAVLGARALDAGMSGGRVFGAIAGVDAGGTAVQRGALGAGRFLAESGVQGVAFAGTEMTLAKLTYDPHAFENYQQHIGMSILTMGAFGAGNRIVGAVGSRLGGVAGGKYAFDATPTRAMGIGEVTLGARAAAKGGESALGHIAKHEARMVTGAGLMTGVNAMVSDGELTKEEFGKNLFLMHFLWSPANSSRPKAEPELQYKRLNNKVEDADLLKQGEAIANNLMLGKSQSLEIDGKNYLVTKTGNKQFEMREILPKEGFNLPAKEVATAQPKQLGELVHDVDFQNSVDKAASKLKPGEEMVFKHGDKYFGVRKNKVSGDVQVAEVQPSSPDSKTMVLKGGYVDMPVKANAESVGNAAETKDAAAKEDAPQKEVTLKEAELQLKESELQAASKVLADAKDELEAANKKFDKAILPWSKKSAYKKVEKAEKDVQAAQANVDAASRELDDARLEAVKAEPETETPSEVHEVSSEVVAHQAELRQLASREHGFVDAATRAVQDAHQYGADNASFSFKDGNYHASVSEAPLGGGVVLHVRRADMPATESIPIGHAGNVQSLRVSKTTDGHEQRAEPIAKPEQTILNNPELDRSLEPEPEVKPDLLSQQDISELLKDAPKGETEMLDQAEIDRLLNGSSSETSKNMETAHDSASSDKGKQEATQESSLPKDEERTAERPKEAYQPLEKLIEDPEFLKSVRERTDGTDMQIIKVNGVEYFVKHLSDDRYKISVCDFEHNTKSYYFK